MDDYHIRNSCMLCGSSISSVWDFKSTPLANTYRNNPEPQKTYPLHLACCDKCFHVQCPVVVDPRLLFDNYLYVSGTSLSFVKHFQDYAKSLEKDFDLRDHSLVVEIGSNDGTLLKQFKCRTVGVDPSVNLSTQSNADGINTICDYFSSSTVDHIISEYGFADIVVANNVMAHIEDLPSVFQSVKRLLHHNGAVVFEVSYILDVLQGGLFDTVYHEHLHYHSVISLNRFLNEIGLELFDVVRVPTHGGSIRVYAGIPKMHQISKKVNDIMLLERACGLFNRKFFKYVKLIKEKQKETSEFLIRHSSLNVGGYGSPAKSVTLGAELQLPPDYFSFIVDDSPLKQGKYHPLFDCPIISFDSYLRETPDLMVILAWNFAKQIKSKIQNSLSYTPNFSPENKDL